MPPVIKNKYLKAILKKTKDNLPKSRFLWAMSTFITGRSAYHQLGWFKSAWQANAVDKNGNPIPWISYPAIDFLDKKCTKNLKLKVWEYGSGNSTLWWAERVQSITALEHHHGWYEHVKEQLKPYKSAQVVFKELGSGYPTAISEKSDKYDIVIIDGRMRVECAKKALPALKDRGVIVWDNTDREKYQQGVKLLHKNGYKSIDFVGSVPIGNYLGQTSIFYKDNNVLGI